MALLKRWSGALINEPCNCTYLDSSSELPHADVQDFLAGDAIITFAAGEVRACENVTIVDDDVMETLEEEFTVSIDGFDPSPLNPMPGPLTMVPVTIIDDDGECIV